MFAVLLELKSEMFFIKFQLELEIQAQIEYRNRDDPEDSWTEIELKAVRNHFPKRYSYHHPEKLNN